MIWKALSKTTQQSLSTFCILKKKYILLISKHKSNREKQVILLMIPNAEGWHYVGVKRLSASLREITPKFQGGFYCLNCLHSFATEKNLESHKEVSENKKIFVM